MSEPFNISTPSRDRGHEAIRVAVVQAIEDLQFNSSSIDVSLDLVDMLFVFLNESIAERQELRDLVDAQRIRIDAVKIQADTALANCDALQVAVAELTGRVAALEPAVVEPEPAPTPEPEPQPSAEG